MKREKTEDKKEKIVKKLQKFLSVQKGFVFAYLHGSFLEEGKFNDIDIALFLDEKKALEIDKVDFEISFSLKIEKYLKMPVDVKILNSAPLAFRYHASCGVLIFSKDELKREEFLCRTWSEYFDFKPIADIYLKEVLGQAKPGD